MQLRPLHDRAIVRRMEEERTSAGGIVGELAAMDIKVGDQVLFGKYAGTEIKIDGEELLVMNESDIMAVFNA